MPDADSQKIILKGDKKSLKVAITQIMGIYQLLENLEVESDSVNENFDFGRRYHPLISLHFIEKSTFRPGTNQPKGQGQNRTKGRLTFRLMDETTETISEANLKALGIKIKEVFGGQTPYIWSKGKELYCYADWARGYQMQILARSQAQAEQLVTKILSLQNHAPIWKYLSKSENTRQAERYPATKQIKTIMGKQETLPLQRPNVEVNFIYAKARITPLLKPILIYDATGKKAEALVL